MLNLHRNVTNLHSGDDRGGGDNGVGISSDGDNGTVIMVMVVAAV